MPSADGATEVVPAPFYLGTNTKLHQTPAETVAFLEFLGPDPAMSRRVGEEVRRLAVRVPGVAARPDLDRVLHFNGKHLVLVVRSIRTLTT